MKLNLFKPENFTYVIPSGIFLKNSKHISSEDAAEVANKILNDYIESLPKVTGYQPSEGNWVMDTFESHWENCFQARLICIEEIPKKECEHKAKAYFDNRFGVYHGNFPECEFCDAKLKAPKWEVDDEQT